MFIVQIIIKRVAEAATSAPPFGPGFPDHVARRADHMIVYCSTEAEDLGSPFYQFTLYCGRGRVIGRVRTSGGQQSEPGRTKRATQWHQHPAPKEAAMTTTPADVQNAVNAINELSALVGRYVYEHAPEEADDAQRAGFEAIRKLTRLKEELPTRAAGELSDTTPAAAQEAA